MVSIFSAAIDWDATGSMLQGISGLMAVAGVVWATKQGRDAVSDWRRQKQDERAISAAERVLTAAYRARSALDSVRANLMTSSEIARGLKVLQDNHPDTADLPKARLERLSQAQAVFNRINAFKDDWAELYATMPIANAYFGPEVEQQLGVIAQQHHIVGVSAEAYYDDNITDADFVKDLRSDIWTGIKNSAGVNAMSVRITEAVAILEQRLLPVLRPNHVAT